MKLITKFVAIDGREFTDRTECEDYEKLIRETDLIMSELHPEPKDDGCKFANGGGYIQHDIETINSVKLKLIKLFATKIDHKWIRNYNPNGHPSYIGRLVDEYNIRPFNKAWYRIQCIDKQGREWGQPYYVEHPERAKQMQVNN